ncbi:PilZ domain-containing protein [Novosphingobium fluoreni]|uniref:PilZ domain-containing protein n=1 Tax=Novosphingobium fluoreni TaxID=1391222 RepID=UPI003DA16B08
MSAEIPRRAVRKSVTLPTQCRTTNGLRDVGEISDISTQGCCIRTDRVMFRVGSHVVIRPKGMEALGGTVRWIAGDCAGLEFDRPIYAPMLDHLAKLHEKGEQVPVSRD